MPHRTPSYLVARAIRSATESQVQTIYSPSERDAFIFGVCVTATRIADALQAFDPNFDRDRFLEIAGADLDLDR